MSDKTDKIKKGEMHYVRLDAHDERLERLERQVAESAHLLQQAVNVIDEEQDIRNGMIQTISSLTSRVNTLEQVLATLAATVFTNQEAHRTHAHVCSFSGCQTSLPEDTR